ncbi:hypothetical protein P9112_010051 [Eukaryota sp. TZLM1-RC]
MIPLVRVRVAPGIDGVLNVLDVVSVDVRKNSAARLVYSADSPLSNADQKKIKKYEELFLTGKYTLQELLDCVTSAVAVPGVVAVLDTNDEPMAAEWTSTQDQHAQGAANMLTNPKAIEWQAPDDQTEMVFWAIDLNHSNLCDSSIGTRSGPAESRQKSPSLLCGLTIQNQLELAFPPIFRKYEQTYLASLKPIFSFSENFELFLQQKTHQKHYERTLTYFSLCRILLLNRLKIHRLMAEQIARC